MCCHDVDHAGDAPDDRDGVACRGGVAAAVASSACARSEER